MCGSISTCLKKNAIIKAILETPTYGNSSDHHFELKYNIDKFSTII